MEDTVNASEIPRGFLALQGVVVYNEENYSGLGSAAPQEEESAGGRHELFLSKEDAGPYRSLVLSRERSEWMTVLASDSLSQI